MTDGQAIQLADVPITEIQFGDRARETYDDIDELRKSITHKMDCGITRGLVSAISVQRMEAPDEEGNLYLLLAGGRRYTACVMADLDTIPAKIYPPILTELDRKEIELCENVDRMNLTWDEKCELTEQIHNVRIEQKGIALPIGGTRSDLGQTPDAPGHTMADTAEEMGKTQPSVSRDLKMAKALKEHPEIRDANTEAEAKSLLRRLQRAKEDKAAAARLAAETSTDNQLIAKQKEIAKGYIRGDFFELVKGLPDRSVNFIEVDPPYAVRLQEQRKQSMRGVTYSTNRDADVNYNEISEDDYPEFLHELFTQCYRVLTHAQWMVVWYGWQWYDTVIETLTEVGFNPCPIPALWVKKAAGQTNSPGTRLGSAAECFIYAAKDQASLRVRGRNNIFHYSPVHSSKKTHTTERPIEMIMDVLETFTSPSETFKILVPFAGSGVTMLAAANMGSSAFGFDLDKTGELRDAFTARVASTKPGSYTSYTSEE